MAEIEKIRKCVEQHTYEGKFCQRCVAHGCQDCELYVPHSLFEIYMAGYFHGQEVQKT